MKNIKLSVLIVFLIMLASQCKKESHEIINPLNYSYVSYDTDFKGPFRCWYFMNENIGFIGTDSGQIYKTTNKGVNFTLMSSPTNLPIYQILFVNENIGYAVGGKSSCGGTNCIVPGGVILRTSDGGNTWVKQDIRSNVAEFHSVYFTSSEKGFVVGLVLSLKTTDGGKTWNEFSFGYNGLMSRIYFINQNVGFIIGIKGSIFKTTDGGNTWTKKSTNTESFLYDIIFADDQVGYCAAEHLLKTVDGGETWTSLNNSVSRYFQVYFSDENHGFTIGDGHYTGGCFGVMTTMLNETKDGGKSWIGHDNLEFGYPLCFPAKNLGYALGSNRKIYRIEIK